MSLFQLSYIPAIVFVIRRLNNSAPVLGAVWRVMESPRTSNGGQGLPLSSSWLGAAPASSGDAFGASVLFFGAAVVFFGAAVLFFGVEVVVVGAAVVIVGGGTGGVGDRGVGRRGAVGAAALEMLHK